MGVGRDVRLCMHAEQRARGRERGRSLYATISLFGEFNTDSMKTNIKYDTNINDDDKSNHDITISLHQY